jgi:hypothetical protein
MHSSSKVECIVECEREYRVGVGVCVVRSNGNFVYLYVQLVSIIMSLLPNCCSSSATEDVAINTVSLGGKPKIFPVEDSIIFVGQSSLPMPRDVLEAVVSFTSCFEDLFIDKSREGHLNCLCGTLWQLVAGTLIGQQNCFLGLGIRGIGKSQFFIALGDWMRRIGGSDCAVLYHEMGSTELEDPFCTRTTNLRQIIKVLASRAGWESIPSHWETIGDCRDWLRDHSKKLLIILDGFEKCYRQENNAGLLRDLAAVGGSGGPRNIVVVLLGTSAHLRNLCFCKGDREEMISQGFLGYDGAVSLNSTKFVPKVFEPITTVDTTKEALRCVGLGYGKYFDIRDFCKASRGQVRGFRRLHQEYGLGIVCVRHTFKAEYNNDVFSRILRILWRNIREKFVENPRELANYIEYKAPFSRAVQEQLGSPLRDMIDGGITVADIYNCADSSLIWFQDGIVSLLHPTDLECCVQIFGRSERLEGELNIAQKISLLYSDNASADEINEMIVCDSLCVTGVKVAGIGHLRFCGDSLHARVCSTGVVRRQSDLFFQEEPSDILDGAFVGMIKQKTFRKAISPATLRKEYPDELGADLIAVFRADSLTGKYASIRFVVVRVQVKLGTSSSSVDKDGLTPISKMRAREAWLVKAIEKESPGTSADNILFVRVLWTSRPTADISAPEDHEMVISSADMFDHWCEPAKRFVKSNKIAYYGFKR